MAEENSTVRKIYVLPRELVERIALFQEDKKLPSEVEAVRRLLDEALKYRDTPDLIIDRFKERLKTDGIPASVARDVLIGHPLVKNIGQEDLDYIHFTMRDGSVFRIHASGYSERQSETHHDWWDEYPPRPKAIEKKKGEFDDDIPF